MKNESYGVTERTHNKSKLMDCKEELLIRGYTTINSGISNKDLNKIESAVTECKNLYFQKYKYDFLKSIDENNTIRAPFLLDPIFLEICFNKSLLKFISSVMGENFILNQQNVIINPSEQKYNQIFWHRDLPYQHFTSSKPLAINAIFCLNDFTINNGCTRVIPGSHSFESFPSKNYLNSFQKNIESTRGNFLVLNSMLYHAGSLNKTKLDRVGINNVFSIPLVKRQIETKAEDFDYDLLSLKKYPIDKLIKFTTPQNVTEFLKERMSK